MGKVTSVKERYTEGFAASSQSAARAGDESLSPCAARSGVIDDLDYVHLALCCMLYMIRVSEHLSRSGSDGPAGTFVKLDKGREEPRCRCPQAVCQRHW